MKTMLSIIKSLKIVFFLLLLIHFNVKAQVRISGTITDIKNNPLNNVSVIDEESQLGCSSNKQGMFSFELPEKNSYSLKISHIGYENQSIEITRNNREIIDLKIQLKPEAIQMDAVLITATKSNRTLREIPGRATYINNETLETAPSQKIDDILSRVSGLNVSRSTGIYSMRPTVTLRGLSGDEQGRTLVLIDGVPVNMSDNGDVNWNRINTQDIDHIEVFKGPGSSLYGNNAMGGVINIITKKPEKDFDANIGFAYGSLNTIKQQSQIMIRNKDHYYLNISEFYQKSDGYNNIPEEDRDNPDYSIKRNLEELGTAIKIGRNKQELLNWEVQYDFYRDKRGEGVQIITPEGVYRQFNTQLIKGIIKGGKDRFNYSWSNYYQYQNYIDINENMRNGNYSRYDVNSDREDWGSIFNINYKLLKNNTITGGFEFKNGSVDAGDYYQTPNGAGLYDSVLNAGKMRFLASYIQNELTFLKKKLILVAGLRFDHVTFYDGSFYNSSPWNNNVPELNENSWSELSPRIALRAFPDSKLSSYVSYAHGFRASILDDLCRSGWMWVGPKYANPELGPEYIDNYEIGFDINLTKNIEFSPSFFYSIGKDFLYYVATGDSLYGRSVYQRQNVSEVEIKGFELDLNAKINDSWAFFSNYSFNESKITRFEENKDLENKYLKYTPKQSIKSGLSWIYKKFNASFAMNYKDMQFSTDDNSQKIDAYISCDLRASVKINKDYYLGLSVFDLFDNQHMESAQYLSPGRLIYLEANIHFQ